MNSTPTLQLLRNADVYAPEPLGLQQLLLGGGKVLWIGCFDGDGRVCGMAVGESGALLATLNELLGRGLALARALPAFTSNPARLLRLAGKGRIAADADLVALDAHGAASEVFIAGAVHVRAGQVQRRGIFEG